MSCMREYGFSSYPECSGHGLCVSGECICDAGWTGIGDLQLLSGVDCDINVKSLKIIALISVIISIPAMMVLVYCILRDDMFASERRYSLKSLCLLASLGTNIFANMYSIGKLVDPEVYLLGRHPLTTFSIIGLVSVIIIVGSSYVLILVNFLESYSRILGKVRQAHFRANIGRWPIYLRVFPMVTFPSAVLLYTSFTYMDPIFNDKVCILVGVFITIIYSFYLVAIATISRLFMGEIKSFLIEVDQRHKLPSLIPTASGKQSNRSLQEDVQKIYSKASVAYNFLIPFVMTGIIVNIVFTAWFFLRRKFTYLVVSQTFFMHLAGPGFAWSLIAVGKRTLKITITSSWRSVGSSKASAKGPSNGSGGNSSKNSSKNSKRSSNGSYHMGLHFGRIGRSRVEPVSIHVSGKGETGLGLNDTLGSPQSGKNSYRLNKQSAIEEDGESGLAIHSELDHETRESSKFSTGSFKQTVLSVVRDRGHEKSLRSIHVTNIGDKSWYSGKNDKSVHLSSKMEKSIHLSGKLDKSVHISGKEKSLRLTSTHRQSSVYDIHATHSPRITSVHRLNSVRLPSTRLIREDTEGDESPNFANHNIRAHQQKPFEVSLINKMHNDGEDDVVKYEENDLV